HHVPGARTVARLAGDAELADPRARALVPRRRLARVHDARLGPRVVAEDAVRVPDGRVRVPVRVVGLEERAIHVHPALLADVPQERQAPVRVAGLAARELEVLLVAARADAQRDLGRARAATRGRELDPEAAVALERTRLFPVELD